MTIKEDVTILARLKAELPVGRESVTLLNCSPESIDLSGWALADRLKRKQFLNGTQIRGGEAIQIPLSGTDAQLSNQGGTISLLDAEGLKIDGVAYTKEQVKLQG
jgi:Lamin Tail Domain